MSKWFITRKGADFEEIGRAHNISPITARLLRNRDVFEYEDVKAYLSADIKKLRDPYELKDIDKAAAVLKDSIENSERIRIIGDYDVDGICSSYILLMGLKRCGANVDARLPHRIHDGYGLSNSLIDEANEAGVKTIITCDNGIAALEQIAHAKELGMKVVVTDHHEVLCESEDSEAMILPDADAVVDPKRKDGYIFSDDKKKKYANEICGAMVAYKFIQVLSEVMGLADGDIYEEFLKELRIFAGWATVCDVMPLTGENRIVVIDSMKNIAGTSNVGIRALLRECEIDPYKVTCYIYGFVIGPCLNATGRLDSAMRGLELLCEENPDVASRIARELRELNDERKDLTAKGQEEALEKLSEYGDNLPDVVVIYLPDMHESLAGIIAGRIKEAVNRPTFVLTDAANDLLKGSGRSIEAYHMHDALSECRDLLEKFGGHKMAAGFSLKKENLEAFTKALNDNSKLTPDDFQEVLHLDMELPLGYLSMNLVKEFDRLEPYGLGNEEPLFAARNVELIQGRIMGKNANVGKILVKDENGNSYDMMVFQKLDKWNEFLEKSFGKENADKLYAGSVHDKMNIKIAYKPNINEFRGTESLQIILKDYML